MNSINIKHYTLVALSLLAILTMSSASSCVDDESEGITTDINSGNDVDSDWKNWTLTENAYSWPEENRVAEEKEVSFKSLPTSKTELIALCEKGNGLKQRITSPQMAAALCYAALCRTKENPDAAKEMYRWLKGPDGITTNEWQNISRRLKEMPYITFALFEGATPLNNYTPNVPYVCEPFTQQSNAYSESNGIVYCKVFVKSGGADSPVPIMTKFHRASGNWFISGTAMIALTGIRQPASQGGGW